MGALACLMKVAGHDVRGSDGPIYPPMSSQLERAGVQAFEGFNAENLDWGPELVVVGNVCSKEHVEVIAAREAGLRLESFPSLLEETLLADRTPIVVSGTHGKTTTTSMVAWMLLQGGLSPSWLVGGVPRNLGRASHLGEGKHFVIEGDEYDTAFFDKKSKFLHYRPQIAILTSLEFDHADIFADMDEIRAAFRGLLALVPDDGLVVVNAADEEADTLVRESGRPAYRYQLLGEDQAPGGADLEAKMMRSRTPRTASISYFEVYERGALVETFQTTTLGAYNISNLLAAMATARHVGIPWETVRAAVSRFRGVKRRQDLIGIAQGVRVIEDFAHHPTAVSMTVEAIRRRYPDKSLRVAFEPRSATSRRNTLFEDFAKAFDAATAVYLGPLHAPEKIPESERLDTGVLADAITGRGVTARHYGDVEVLMEALIEESVPGDTLLVLTCGAFGGLCRRVLHGLGDPVTFAEPEEITAVDTLLTAHEFPRVRDVMEVETLVIQMEDKQVVGSVSLHQTSPTEALLFGLCVDSSRRGQGLGWVLADSVLRRARRIGVERVYLVTDDSSDFLVSRLGFCMVGQDDLPESVRESANFKARWAPGAMCMRQEFPRG